MRMPEIGPKSRFPNARDVTLLLNQEGGQEHAERFTKAAWLSVIEELIQPGQPDVAAQLRTRAASVLTARDESGKSALDADINKLLLGVVMSPNVQERVSLDAWVDSDVGQQTLRGISQKFVELLGGIHHEGIAGHGLDHFARETLISLRFQEAGLFPGYQQISLLASLLHDIGRVAERPQPGVRHAGVQGIDHAKVSMLVAKSILDDFPGLPPRIKLELLHAIAIHQSSGNIEQQLHDTAPVAFGTRKPDQADIVGETGFKRMVEFDVGREGLAIAIPVDYADQYLAELPAPGKTGDNSLLVHSEFYLRNLFPDIDDPIREYVNQRKVSVAAFWLIVTADFSELQQSIFAPEMGDVQSHWSKKRLPDEVWKQAQQQATSPNLQRQIDEVVRDFRGDLTQLVLAYIDKPNGGNEEYVRKVIEKVGEISPDQRSGFLRGFAYMLIKKQKLVEGLIQVGQKVDPQSWQAPIIDWAIRQLG